MNLSNTITIKNKKMKKLVLAMTVAAFVVLSCEKKQEESAADIANKEANNLAAEAKPEAAVVLSPVEEGKSLVEGTDCLSCHKVDAKLVGPSYQDVAAKYTDADIDHLATKIIEGGKGVWGEIPMTPHAGLSPENAKLMVKYILAQKK